MAALRFGRVDLSKYAYTTVIVAPLGALVLLGYPAEAVLAAGLGTVAGDLLCRRAPYPSAVNAGREVVATAAAIGVYALVMRLTVPAGAGRALSAFRIEAVPAAVVFLLAYFLFSRGLFYFSLAYRRKLVAGEWMVVLRYEVITAALGAVAAGVGVSTVSLYAEQWGAALLILAFVVAAGVLARALMVEAIASEELRKVIAMETVIAAGMPLAESLAQKSSGWPAALSNGAG